MLGSRSVRTGHSFFLWSYRYGRVVQAAGKQSLPALLIANKTDLRERLAVTRAQGQQMAAQLGIQVAAYVSTVLAFRDLIMHRLTQQMFETSALEGAEIESPFEALAQIVSDSHIQASQDL